MKQPAPPACDPRLEADVPAIPAQPAGASIVAPATMEERVATALYLGWVSAVVDVAGQLRARAFVAKRECGARR